MNKNIINNILFINDDSKFCKLLSDKLFRGGILVKHVKNAKMAIFEIDKKIPDLIITDIFMPELNGFELIRKLKGNPNTANLEYLIVSNYGENKIVYDVEFLNTLGIRKYLIKSNYTLKELVKEIEKSLIECKTNPLKQ